MSDTLDIKTELQRIRAHIVATNITGKNLRPGDPNIATETLIEISVGGVLEILLNLYEIGEIEPQVQLALLTEMVLSHSDFKRKLATGMISSLFTRGD